MRMSKLCWVLVWGLMLGWLSPSFVAAQHYQPAGFGLLPPQAGDTLLAGAGTVEFQKQITQLEQLWRNQQYAPAGDLATTLLARYPGRVGAAAPPKNQGARLTDAEWPYHWLRNYPEIAYHARARLWLARGDAVRAEADLSQALAYGFPRRIADTSYSIQIR